MLKPYKRSLLIITSLVIGLELPLLAVELPPLLQSVPARFWQSAQTGEKQESQAAQLLKEGSQQLDANRPKAALSIFQRSLKLYQQAGDRQGEGQALKLIGLAYLDLKDYKQAIVYQQKCLEVARSIQDRDLESRAWLNLGIAYDLLGNSAKAIESFQTALQVAQAINNREVEWKALAKLGVVYATQKKYVQAIEVFQKALPLVQTAKQPTVEYDVLAELSVMHYKLQQYDKALEIAQQSLTVARALRDQKLITMALSVVGSLQALQTSPAQGVAALRQAVETARSSRNPQAEGQALEALGALYEASGEYLQAIEVSNQLLQLGQRTSNPQMQQSALQGLGTVYSTLGETAKALDFYQKRLSVARQAQDQAGIFAALMNLGNLFELLNTSDQAIQHYEEGLSVAQALKDNKKQANALFQLATTYKVRGESKQALDAAQKSLEFARSAGDRSQEWRSLLALGQIYMNLNNPKAIQVTQAAVAITQQAEPIATDLALRQLGLAYRLFGNYPSAIDALQRSLAIAQQRQLPEAQGSALHDLGLALFEAGKAEQAESALRQAVEIWESLRAGLNRNDLFKVSLFDTQADTYRNYQKVLISRKKVAEALEIAERGRARAFLEQVAQRLPNQPAKIALPNLQQIQQIARSQNATLVEYSIIKSEFEGQGRRQSEAAVLYIWVVNPAGAISFRQVDLKTLQGSLEDEITRSRKAVGVGDRSSSIEIVSIDGNQERQSLQQLHQLLIEPIADLLPKDPNQRVIFVPSGALFLVPFSALQDAKGQYLLEKHTILTAPAIQLLHLTQQQQSKVQRANLQDVLILGNPTMPKVVMKTGSSPEQLKPLLGAEQEAIAIAQLLQTKALIGNQATKAAVLPRLSRASIIHFATHGLLDDFQGQGVPGALALAPASNAPNDGLLTANEILTLSLNAKLVVLSACSTGQGRITGDGVIGLSRSLITAGVPSVIVSLWSVPDAPTAELMVEFYRNWREKKMDKAQALRQAMLTTMKIHPNPRAWAAFTLIGESE